jgi:uncharacterized membrane protein
VASALCYVPLLITGIIFLVLEPYNKKPVIRFHAFQSIFLGAVFIALEVILRIFTGILISTLGWYSLGLFGLVLSFVWLMLFLLWLFLAGSAAWFAADPAPNCPAR